MVGAVSSRAAPAPLYRWRIDKIMVIIDHNSGLFCVQASVYDQLLTSAVKLITDQVQGRKSAHADPLLNTLTHSESPMQTLLRAFSKTNNDLKQSVGSVSVPELVDCDSFESRLLINPTSDCQPIISPNQIYSLKCKKTTNTFHTFEKRSSSRKSPKGRSSVCKSSALCFRIKGA